MSNTDLETIHDLLEQVHDYRTEGDMLYRLLAYTLLEHPLSEDSTVAEETDTTTAKQSITFTANPSTHGTTKSQTVRARIESLAPSLAADLEQLPTLTRTPAHLTRRWSGESEKKVKEDAYYTEVTLGSRIVESIKSRLSRIHNHVRGARLTRKSTELEC
ncbi:hypothetical protein BJX61DRAFT_542700 [Aspergillus egyptiacus]|nr:hypothetical protein BJX61DRAFT_542700 [Aspergillus egyptiacus]